MGFTITAGVEAMPMALTVRTTTGTSAQVSSVVNTAIADINRAAGSSWRRGPDVAPHPDLSTADRTHRPPVGELWVITTPQRFPRLPKGNYAAYHVATPPGGRPQTMSQMVVLTQAVVGAGRTPASQLGTILHEFGHVAGLDHHFTPWGGQCQLMSYGGPRRLGTGDIAGLRWLAGRAPFIDVANTSYFSAAARWAFDAGVSNGNGQSSRLSPNQRITRAQLVDMIWRAAGRPSPPANAPRFSDVPPSAPFAPAVQWAVARGIITGPAVSRLFHPQRPAARAQTVAMLWRRAGAPAMAASVAGFADVRPAAPFASATRWARQTGLTSNIAPANRFNPTTAVTRAEALAMLWRSR